MFEAVEVAEREALRGGDAASVAHRSQKRGRWLVGVAACASAALVAKSRVSSSSSTTLIARSDGLYSCSNGDPGIAARYRNGEWGTVDGDWYVLAQTADAGDYDCGRMIFELDGRDDKMMHQSMLYVGEGDDDDDDNGFFIDGEDYWWNITEKQVHKKESGLWKSEKNRFWSEVWTVGEYKGSKWFGWYICGPAVKATRRGIAYILKDSVDADDGFYSMVKREMKAAGLFEYGIGFEETSQTDNCDYTFPTAGL